MIQLSQTAHDFDSQSQFSWIISHLFLLTSEILLCGYLSSFPPFLVSISPVRLFAVYKWRHLDRRGSDTMSPELYKEYSTQGCLFLFDAFCFHYLFSTGSILVSSTFLRIHMLKLSFLFPTHQDCLRRHLLVLEAFSHLK